MVDGLQRRDESGVRANRLSGVGVPVEPGEVAARDLKPNPVTLPEEVACGPQVDFVFVGPVGALGERYLARIIPSARFLAYPEGLTSTSLATKSVSRAELDANSVTVIGPVTSMYCSNGGVVYTSTSCLASTGRWSNTPGATRLG